MKRLIETFKNIFAIEELKNRIFTTLWLLVIFRIGSYIVLPGIDPAVLEAVGGAGGSMGGIGDLLNTLLGGAFQRASIFALGIMPYISASIVIQLLQVSMPYFKKMQKEGETGRKRITQITRMLTILICLGQSLAYLKGTVPAEAIAVPYSFFMFTSMLILTAGTIFCMWLGEKITDKGLGNGISLLIMIGIIASLPGALLAEAASKGVDQALIFILELVALFFVVIAAVYLQQAIRRVTVHYAKQIVGKSARKQELGGRRSYIPLRVNSAGVMPIIFAQSLMFVPSMVAAPFAEGNDTLAYIAQAYSDFTSLEYNITFGLMIVLFAFVYTAITVNPKEIAENMKASEGFVPGVAPGEETVDHIGHILDRITLPGAVFLAIIAIFPAFAMAAGVGGAFSQFYGGTSLLIMVGVILDTLQQIEGYLLKHHYDTLMESGKVKGTNMAAI